MQNGTIKTELNVIDNKVSVMRIGNIDYISLTDLAKYKEKERTDYIIQNWMRTTSTVQFLGTWEYLYNENFNSIEFDGFKNESGTNTFILTPKKWIKATNAIGIISKQGRYGGGTFAHPDIAFEFASWLSPSFKLYLIREFERLKKNEAYQTKIEWHANRVLAKANYLVHTDSIKKNIVPSLTDKQKKYIYAEEADVLNVALFGMTAKEWREANPALAETGNIRDYTDLIHLVILSNLENINAELINASIVQSERLIKLNETAKRQMQLFENNRRLKELMELEKQVNSKELLKISN